MNLSERAKKALEQIHDYSKVLSIYEAKEFVEIVVNRWGDICLFRVYNNGMVTER